MAPSTALHVRHCRLSARVASLLAGLVAAGPLSFVSQAVAPAVAHADDVADEADLQFNLGADAYEKGDFRGALEHFLASNRLVPNRNVIFNIARTYEQLK